MLARELTLAATLIVALSGCLAEDGGADLILRGGNVITVDSTKPNAEAIAIANGTIVAVGTNAEIDSLRGPNTEVIELAGNTAVPGLIDGHLHYPGIGKLLNTVFLDTTKTPAEAVAIVAREVAKAKPGDWIIGQGWHTVNWKQGYPDNAALSAASPNNPVMLVGMASHASWVNAKAFELAGVNATTADPAGGQILKDASGKPTGILLETAQTLVSSLIPPETREVRKTNTRLSGETLARLGFAGVIDAGASMEDVAIYKELLAEGGLPIRLGVMVRVRDVGVELDSVLKHAPLIGAGDNRLTVRTIKIHSDGALGARGAAMLAPYSDARDRTGLLQQTEDQLYALVTKSMRAGYQVAIHAIGDRGNRIALNAFERAMKEIPGTDPRHRIEHAQIVAPEDIPRFGQLGVIASMQPIHAPTDMGFAETRVGPERIKGGYAWQSILKAGGLLVGSSDTPAFPVDYTNPMWNLHAAVTRRDQHRQPPQGWYPDQAVSRLDALKMFTINAAYSTFDESLRGSLTPGKLGDVTILTKDILTIPVDEILTTEVVMTIVGGKVVYRQAN